MYRISGRLWFPIPKVPRPARRAFGEEIEVALTEPCKEMLDYAGDLPVEKVMCRAESMPFGDAHFDIVVATWVLETTACPRTALFEMLRVLRPGGTFAAAFCADRRTTPLARIMRAMIERRRLGRFLDHTEVADTLSELSGSDRIWLPSDGPSAALLLRKSAEVLPDLRAGIAFWGRGRGAATGELQARGGSLQGVALDIASSVAELAGSGDVIASRIVKVLVAGSGIGFNDLGEHNAGNFRALAFVSGDRPPL